MEKKLNNSIDEVIDYIVNTKEYKNCIKYKKEMDKDNNIKDIVSKIKKLQKKYVNSNDSKVMDEINSLEDELCGIDLYAKYNQNLEIVNNMINYVKEELNDYFYKVLNENTSN